MPRSCARRHDVARVGPAAHPEGSGRTLSSSLRAGLMRGWTGVLHGGSLHALAAGALGQPRGKPGGRARSRPARPGPLDAVACLPAHQAWEATPCKAPRSRGRATPARGWSGGIRAGRSMGAAGRWPARSVVPTRRALAAVARAGLSAGLISGPRTPARANTTRAPYPSPRRCSGSLSAPRSTPP